MCIRDRPYSATESVFGRGIIQFIIIIGILMSVIAIAASYGLWSADDPRWQTVLFTTLVFSQLAVAIAARSEVNSVFRIGFFANRYMIMAVLGTIVLQLVVIYLPLAQDIFDTIALTPAELALSFALALLVFALVEIWKWIFRLRQSRNHPAVS